jgi:serine/threonine protein phosphatase PrpC
MDEATPHRAAGTTATTFFLAGRRLTVTNPGADRLILARDQDVLQFTRDHRVDDPREPGRIVKAGGRSSRPTSSAATTA